MRSHMLLVTDNISRSTWTSVLYNYDWNTPLLITVKTHLKLRE